MEKAQMNRCELVWTHLLKFIMLGKISAGDT